MDSGEDIAPIAILMDELRSEDVQLRLNAIHSVPTIALALGPDRAREELVPFLQDSVDDEDEVLLALAEELGRNFEEYIGGKEYAHILLGPLENLSAVEETLVRDKVLFASLQSITKVAVVLSQAQIEEYYIPLLKRLSQGEWFTSRTSSAALSPCYPGRFAQGFAALGSDDTPMVRRAAAKWLGPLLTHFSPQHVLSDGLPIYRRLQSDDQDSVRLLTVEDLIAIAQRMSPAEVKEQLLKQIRHSIGDKSWRVRYMAANHFNELADAVGVELVREELTAQYVQLLKDNEAEVRTAAAGQIPGFSKLLDKDVILARIVPCVRDLSQIPPTRARRSCQPDQWPRSTAWKRIDHRKSSPSLPPSLKDDFPEVRLNIISKLEQLIMQTVIGIELLSETLLPAIVELAEDKSWRLGNLCMSWLGDTVFSIREAATVNLKKLTEVFGVEWAKVQSMTTVQAITTIAPSLNLEIVRSEIIDPLLQLASDPIPNIRFNVAKSLEVLATAYGTVPAGNDFVQTRIVPALEQQKNDQDADVRYFAARALQKALAAS
ncbi:armadillo-type protein [Mycena galopus ATCC 62051]|nr:armadillo-type protein [Mycena galopus ATCC 62051]